jgi:hypothetical protein
MPGQLTPRAVVLSSRCAHRPSLLPVETALPRGNRPAPKVSQRYGRFRRGRTKRRMLRPIRKPPAHTMDPAMIAMNSSAGAPGVSCVRGPTRRTTTAAESAPATVATAATDDCPTIAGRTPGGGITREFPARMPPVHAVRNPTASQGTTVVNIPGWVGT